MIIELIGWTAGILFAFCGLPQAIMCHKQGHAKGVSSVLIWMWLSGEILMTTYVLAKHGLDLPLLVNYAVNTIFVAIIMKYKYFPRSQNEG
jgi:uncharacterized protein with PQ loop repeat